MIKHGFCIYINSPLGSPGPAARKADDYPVVFETRLDAERAIAGSMMTRLREFLDGRRGFENAMTIEEYITEVDVFQDGSITDEDGNVFSSPSFVDVAASEA